MFITHGLMLLKHGLMFPEHGLMFLKHGLMFLKHGLMFLKHGLMFLKHGLMFLKHGLMFLKHSLMFLKHGLMFLKHGLMFPEHGLMFLKHGLMFPTQGPFFLTQTLMFFRQGALFLAYSFPSQTHCLPLTTNIPTQPKPLKVFATLGIMNYLRPAVFLKTINTYKRRYFEWLCWVAALVLLFFMGGNTAAGPLCFFKWAGISWCPGCGIGHAINSALHLHLGISFKQHPLGIPAVFIMLHRIKQLSFKPKPIQL